MKNEITSVSQKFRVMIVAVIWLNSQSVFAADSATITVRGEVYAEPCKVYTSNVDIDFGRVPASDLQVAGSRTAWTAPKKIQLMNCPAGTNKVAATFKGVPDDGAGAGKDLFKNTGTAGGVSIWMKVDDTTIKNGSSRSVDVVDTSASFSISAAAQTVDGKATPGTISSMINVEITYQ
jgi:minor fimbrial subunit